MIPTAQRQMASPACRLLLALLGVALLALAPFQVQAQEGEVKKIFSDKDAEAAKALFGDDYDADFVYVREGRHDPFMPMEQIVFDQGGDEEEILTGMRRFEPGQLRLVAIVKQENRNIAMVEDATGKGYLIHKGLKIGRTGVVAEILPNRVVVRQTSFTRAGEVRYNDVDMVLKSKGEEE